MRSFQHYSLIVIAIVLGFTIPGSVQAALTTFDLQLANDDPNNNGIPNENPADTTDPIYNTFSYRGTTDTGTLFYVTSENVGSSGSGLINPYLRVQSNGNEQGFNSDRTTAYFDEGVSQTTSLDINLVSTFTDTTGGTGLEYGEFLLDINESLVSLNQVQIFAATSDYATSTSLTPTGEGTDANGNYFVEFDPTQTVEVFRMSDIANWYEVLVPSSGSGSGTYDMRLFVEWTDIALLGSQYTHLIFYSQFGDPPGSNSTNSGFEEWSTARDDLQQVPEPSTWALLLITACGALFFQYRVQRNQKLAATTDATGC